MSTICAVLQQLYSLYALTCSVLRPDNDDVAVLLFVLIATGGFNRKQVAGAICCEIPQPNVTVDWPTYTRQQCMAYWRPLDAKHNCPTPSGLRFVFYCFFNQNQL